MSETNKLNGAQVIVDYLIQQKSPYAFGLCGHGNIQFIDALYERQHDIKTISVHHESVAGFMADVHRAADLAEAVRKGIDAHKPYLIDVDIAADINPAGAGIWDLPGLGQSKPSIGTRYVPD
jgi:thiamine pyrophosphate-dependent acetolactate synthase large subunit-like protein